MAFATKNAVLVTGASGFLGKVLVEELVRLREKYGVGQIFILLRGKGPFDASTRFEQQVASSQCFASLNDDWKRSIDVLEGDLANTNCGLQPCDYERVCNTITHIIHTAACIKFDSTVSEAISSNVDSACNILALAKHCHNLQQLVVTSTAYVTPPKQGPIYEDLVQLPYPASELVSDLRYGRLQKHEAIAATGHPNIYSLSKCLAEHLLIEARGFVPVTIVRPSIISAAIRRPEPGWIDSPAAFGGLVLAFGTGALRVLNGRKEATLDIVPVDMVAHALIYETFRQETKTSKREKARIVFSVATLKNSLPLGNACEVLERLFERRFAYIGPQGYDFKLQDLFHHGGQVFDRKGDELQQNTAKKRWKVISGMNAVFEPYTNFTYDFRPVEARICLNPIDYIHTICQGVRRNLMDMVSSKL
ncbi:hypothetical protein ACHAO7_010161 [Fusarium culmorum]